MANMEFCKTCGEPIIDEPREHSKERKPCPRCGSVVRSFVLDASPGHYSITGSNASASVKTNLSGYFASSAALFSRKAHALECLDPAAVSEVVRMEHRSYAIGAVIAAASYLETAINELYLEAVDRNRNTFPEERLRLAELMGHVWNDIEQMTVLAKYQVALTLAEVPPYLKGEDPYQSVDGLFRLRNALVHYKPEWDTELEEHRKLEERLGKRFKDSRMSSPRQAFFPHRCLGHGCAAWATTTALGFYRDFMRRLGLNMRSLGDAVGLATEASAQSHASPTSQPQR
jgi:hypothetical protein